VSPAFGINSVLLCQSFSNGTGDTREHLRAVPFARFHGILTEGAATLSLLNTPDRTLFVE